MANEHDLITKDLFTNRQFSIAFLKTYFPKDLVSLVDWDTVELDSANVEHVRQQNKENTKQKEMSDLTFLFKFKDGQNGAAFFHVESQTDNDITLLLRVRHYQTAYLLDYLKRNKGVKKLPLIVSIIYYADKTPFNQSLNIYDYFHNPRLAEQHAFKTHLIDLSKLSDDEIMQHDYIAGYELILKHVRKGDIDSHIEVAAKHLIQYDQYTRQVLIKYMANFSDMQRDSFYDKIISSKPRLKGDVMTVAEQWKQEGVQQGISQEKFTIAKIMLKAGEPDDKIIAFTSIDQKTLNELKQQ
jgi:predicted transposase/invertase (TIGR01784 family)